MEESLRREIGRLREENALFLEVSKAIVSELEIEKVFDLVAEKAREIVGAETMAAPIINDDRASYTYQAAVGKDAADIAGATFGIHVGMCGWVLENERSLLFGKSKEWWIAERTSWEEGQQSALLVPLFGRRKIIGGLSAIGKIGGGSFTEHDLDLLTIFANQVSVAIENARLFREHEEMIHKLEVEISERAAVQSALEEEKERLAVTLRSIGDGVITTDTAGNVVLMNKVAEKLTGWILSEARGRALDEVFSIVDEKTGEPLLNPVEEVLRTGKIVDLPAESFLVSRDGGEGMSVADSAAPIMDRASRIIGAVLVFRDVTMKRKTEAELLKARKIESVGVLAGGIAHDFNNILMAIMGNIELAAQLVDPAGEVHDLLADAERASCRARDLTQQLLTFSKGGDPVRETASIPEIIEESTRFVLRGGKVAARFTIAEDLRLVSIDRGQMSQVIQNLIINAQEAMPEGGNIEITCDNVAAAEIPVSASPETDEYVRIRIADSGPGISDEHLDRIFDPYFSTKEKGSGLGLAITHSIVRKHGGAVTVSTGPGEGTTFSVYLPSSVKALASEPAVVENTAGRGARILVMDDDQGVRKIAERLLTRSGFDVILAADGDEAVRLFRSAEDASSPVDLIIVDLTVPGGMGGEAAAEEIHRIRPDVPIIVSSGYSNDAIMANYGKYGFKAAVAKPFRIKELLGAVNQVLAAGEIRPSHRR